MSLALGYKQPEYRFYYCGATTSLDRISLISNRVFTFTSLHRFGSCYISPMSHTFVLQGSIAGRLSIEHSGTVAGVGRTASRFIDERVSITVTSFCILCSLTAFVRHTHTTPHSRSVGGRRSRLQGRQRRHRRRGVRTFRRQDVSPTDITREDVGEDVGVVECGLYAIVCVDETSVLRRRLSYSRRRASPPSDHYDISQ